MGLLRTFIGVVALSSSVGCYDDALTVLADGGTGPDTLTPSVDAATCPGRLFCPQSTDEGGEVRVEYVRLADGTAAARASGYVYDDPGSQDYFEYLDLDGCTDVRDRSKWPFATNPMAERLYHDPGGILITGGPAPLDLPRQPAGRDHLGRQHPANAWFQHFGGSDANDAATYFAGTTTFDVVFPGTWNLPGTILDDALYMPSGFTLASPAVAPYALSAGTDHSFAWTVDAQNVPPGLEMLSTVMFTGADGPVVVCIQPYNPDRAVTVPAAMIDIVRSAYSNGGTLVRQASTHGVRELIDVNGPTNRRFDVIAGTGYETSFVVD